MKRHEKLLGLSEVEEQKFKDVFDLSKCRLSLGPQTAFQKWIYEAPVYHQCTILGEMVIYLFVAAVALSLTIGLFVRNYKKQKSKVLAAQRTKIPEERPPLRDPGRGELQTGSLKENGLSKSRIRKRGSSIVQEAVETTDMEDLLHEVTEEEKGEVQSKSPTEDPEIAAGEILFYRLTITVVVIPLLAYVFLLFIGITVIPMIIKSTTIAASVSKCRKGGDGGILRYNPVAFKLISGPYELAILKMEKNKTGPFAVMDHTILYTYGKGGSTTYFLRSISHWAQQGFEVFAWDLPGFGFSKGPGQPKDFVAAQKSVLDFVSKKSKKPVRDIILYGFSMGGAITTITAGDVLPKRLLLHNPLDALSNVMVDFCKMTGFIGGPGCLADFLDSREAMMRFAASGGCLMLFASGRDQMIDYKRHRDTFTRFYEHSKSFCGMMVYEGEADHHVEPWSSKKYPIALKKFLGSMSILEKS